LVNTKRPLITPEGHCVFYIGHTSNIGVFVTDIVTDVLICFPIIAQRSKDVHYFHRVVGLMV